MRTISSDALAPADLASAHPPAPGLGDDDRALRAGFEAMSLASDAFGHREHVQLAWGYLQDHDAVEAIARLLDGLLAFATSKGAADRFHHTLTVAWVRLVAAAAARYPALTFADLVNECPCLLDKDLPLAHYSRDRLFSAEARASWVEPDRQVLP